MSGSLAGYTIEEVCRIIDRSWAGWRLKYTLAPGVREIVHPDAKSVICGLDLPNVNTVFQADLNPAGLDRRIREISAPYLERSVGFTWWVGPSTRPDDLGQTLIEAGFTPGLDLMGMAGDLSLLSLEGAAAEIEPVRIRGAENMARFCRASAQAYSSRPGAAQLALAAQIRLDSGTDGKIANFAVRLSGEICATASLVVEGDWALLAGVGTIPGTRGRGLGTVVTVRALREARDRGCGLAVLQASEAGRPIYEKLGFREYCRLRRFVLAP